MVIKLNKFNAWKLKSDWIHIYNTILKTSESCEIVLILVQVKYKWFDNMYMSITTNIRSEILYGLHMPYVLVQVNYKWFDNM